jgi:hypothetical protein
MLGFKPLCLLTKMKIQLLLNLPQQFGGKQDIQVKITFLGEANVRYIEGTNAVGIDLADPYSQDDVVVTRLHILREDSFLK